MGQRVTFRQAFVLPLVGGMCTAAVEKTGSPVGTLRPVRCLVQFSHRCVPVTHPASLSDRALVWAEMLLDAAVSNRPARKPHNPSAALVPFATYRYVAWGHSGWLPKYGGKSEIRTQGAITLVSFQD